MLETFKGKVICPRCDGNGLIYKAKVENTALVVFICDECEATWQKIEDIEKGNFVDLSTLLEGHGISYGESEIVSIGYNWNK